MPKHEFEQQVLSRTFPEMANVDYLQVLIWWWKLPQVLKSQWVYALEESNNLYNQ